MTTRRHIRRAIQQHARDQKLTRLTLDPAKSEQIADAHRDALRTFQAARGTAGVNLDGYPGPGAINGYYCPDCQHATVTVHIDEGVTPMFLACRATDGCHGRAVSMGYRATRDQLPPPTFEWYRPTGIELRRLDFAMQDHVNRGGLMLREVSA